MGSDRQPLPKSADSHIGYRHLFEGILGRNTADYSIQSAQKHHVRLSLMADRKANIIITVSSIVLSLTLSRLNEPELRLALGTLSFFTLVALVLAILAVLPKYRPMRLKDPDDLPDYFNIMFFAHFSELPKDRFFQLWADALRTDRGVYEILTNDLYSLGLYLARHKFPYLRLSYLFFLTGFVSACVIQAFELLFH
ncbi:MAG: hypothetical protein KDI37_10890 [Xanthomonadales bacterium]|nr:hypothetical protein [Xanthomonadales bacterium]MCB1642229.1 hypothetical protein [Xanthomonadales bacterium]